MSTASDRRTSAPRRTEDAAGVAGLCAAGLSTVGSLTLLVGHLVDPHGFDNGAHPSVANDVAFFAFVLGLLGALLLGGAGRLATRRSRRSGRASTGRSPATLALAWGVALLVVAVVGAALGG